MPVHNQNINKSVAYLRQLDIPTDEISAYLYLLQHGSQTVLALSRGLNTGRTKLYPLLENLAGKQLVKVQDRHYGTSYEATAIESLGFLVAKHEQNSQNLRSSLPEALYALQELQKTSPVTFKLTEYHGLEGIKQMYWNISTTKTDYYILELPAVKKQLGKHLTQKLWSHLSSAGVGGIVLTNQKKPTAPYRYISPTVFTIKCETYTYNDVVGLISYDNGVFYGIEINSPLLAQQYKQLISVLAKLAG